METPGLSDVLAISCLSEVARRAGINRARIFRLRWRTAHAQQSLIEPLAQALYRTPDFIRAAIEIDRRRIEQSRKEKK
jgi:hypothetical protein